MKLKRRWEHVTGRWYQYRGHDVEATPSGWYVVLLADGWRRADTLRGACDWLDESVVYERRFLRGARR